MNLSTLMLGLAMAGATSPDRDIEPACAVFVHMTIASYDGPIVIEDVCLTSLEYSENVVEITAIDYGQKIFHGDFEVWP